MRDRNNGRSDELMRTKIEPRSYSFLADLFAHFQQAVEIGRPNTKCLGLLVVALLTRGSVALAQCHHGVIEQIPRTEYDALVELYKSTGGPFWILNEGWLDPNYPTWENVVIEGFKYDPETCTVLQIGHVTSLLLQNNGLTGSIPA